MLVALSALLCGLVASGSGAAAAAANVGLTQVSRDPYVNPTSFHSTEVEPDTFAFGSTIVATFQAGRFFAGGASNIGWSTSDTGGVGYRHGFLPGTTVYASPRGPYARVTDPAVAYDAKHGAWLINSVTLLETHEGLVGAAVIVNRSTDGAATFGTPVTVSSSATQDYDKNWIVCDNSPISPYYGSCYVQWDDFAHNNQLHMAFSRDGGLTWTDSTVPESSVIGGQPLVQPGGKVIVPINNGPETAVESFVSANGGVSYSGPFEAATAPSHVEGGDLRSPNLPTAEIDGAGNVYVAWADCRFVADCAANDIVYTRSSDGEHWSAVTRVPIDSPTSGVDHFLPGLAVDSKTGGATTRLALTYYFYPHTNCTPATCELDVGFLSSSDGGASWTAPTQLAGPTKVTQLPLTGPGFMVGDYISTSFVHTSRGDQALPVFAVGLPVPGKTCTLGDLTSCNVPMEAPSNPLTGATVAASKAAAPVVSTPPSRPRGGALVTLR